MDGTKQRGQTIIVKHIVKLKNAKKNQKEISPQLAAQKDSEEDELQLQIH